MQPKKLGLILEQSDPLNALMPQARRLLELRRYLAESLPEDLARNCTVANWRQGKIVIFAWNSAVAAKLNLLRPALIKALQARRAEVTAMVIQVQPQTPPHTPHEKGARLSRSASQAILDIATQLSDSELKTSMIRLAGREVSER